jgi:hypothetical protein
LPYSTATAAVGVERVLPWPDDLLWLDLDVAQVAEPLGEVERRLLYLVEVLA